MVATRLEWGDTNETTCCEGWGEAVAVVAVAAGALAGAIVGMGVGSLVRRDYWDTLPLPYVDVPMGTGWGLRWSVPVRW